MSQLNFNSGAPGLNLEHYENVYPTANAQSVDPNKDRKWLEVVDTVLGHGVNILDILEGDGLPAQNSQSGPVYVTEPKDNTLMYVGIGAGVLVVVALIIILIVK